MAIALDTSAYLGDVTSTAQTVAYTVTGSNPILFVSVLIGDAFNSDVMGTVTYNGVALTRIARENEPVSALAQYLFVLAGPATGTHNIVVTPTSSHRIISNAISYTGAAQTGQPDNFGVALGANVQLPSTTGVTLTPVADNCWIVMSSWKTNGSILPVAASGITLRTVDVNALAIGDTNAAVHPAASTTMLVKSASDDGQQSWSHIAASFAPFIAPASAGVKGSNMSNIRNLQNLQSL